MSKISATSAETRQPVFCIVDPSLRDFVGHHHAYDEAVARGATAAGFRAITLGHRDVRPDIAASMDVVPCFRRDMWGGVPLVRHLPRRLRAPVDIILTNRDFARDLENGLRDINFAPGSILFAHMIFRNQLSALASFVQKQPKQGPLSIVLLLRYHAAFYDNAICARAFRRLERAAANGIRVRLASDSARLSRELGRLTSLPIEVMPIPHTSTRAGPPHTEADRRLRFVSLGNARDEKGYVEILRAIQLLRANDELGDVEFVLQSNDAAPDVQAAIDRFAQDCPPNVTLLRHALTPAEYEDQLTAADVVMVPYWHNIYHARTSGVFLEGVAAGKIVIATGDTWMSDELQRYGAGVLVRDRDPASIADAIRTVVRNHSDLHALAESGRAKCLARHNPTELVRQAIMGSSRELPDHRGARRIAVLYPWGDFFAASSGAALRCNLLVNKLAPHVEEIRVLQDGPWVPMPRIMRLAGGLLRLVGLRPARPQAAAPAATASARALPGHRNVFVEHVSLRFRQHLLRRLFRLPILLLLGRKNFGQELILWYHLERRFDPAFKARVGALVAWADVVLLEYTFWAAVVSPQCRAAGKPLIISTHDVLHEQVTASRWLRRLTRRVEIAGLATADRAICVSVEDQRCFAAGGVSASIIPNPVDVQRVRIRVPGDVRTLLRQLYDIDVPPGAVCLFVGSHFGPNIEAAGAIRELSEQMLGMGVPTAFVVAGACAEPARYGNYIALGRVDNAVLTLLYQLASLVLIPLRNGTGSSLKTIEAMASGRTVIGTEVAFRCLPVTPGQTCVLENDLDRWPDLIRDLLANPSRAAMIGAAAGAAMAAYDYRNAFDAYLGFLGIDDRAEPDRTPDDGSGKATMIRELLARCIMRDRLDLACDLLEGLEGKQARRLRELLVAEADGVVPIPS